MADFFLSVPGLLATAGIGALILLPGRARRTPAVRAGGGDDALPRAARGALSIVVLVSGLWVLLSGHYGTDAPRWASGAIGTVVGYWLKP
jgi:hypothetical protein